MLASIFFAGGNPFFAGLFVILGLLLSIAITLCISSLLGTTILKGVSSSFTLELPPYRKPQFCKVIARSILDRTIFVLGRAVCVSVPAGALIWILQNITIADTTLLTMFANLLEPFGSIMGLSGAILASFLLGIPANEIVIPILLMYYSQSGTLIEPSGITELGQILRNNGWTMITALCTILFSFNHFPCATTLWTIAKETKSIKWTVVSFLLPTLVGIGICIFVNLIATIL